MKGSLLCVLAVLGLFAGARASAVLGNQQTGPTVITRKGAFAGAPTPGVTQRFVNCHETFLDHVVPPPKTDSWRRRLSYTMQPEIPPLPTDLKTKFCYFDFVHDSNFSSALFLSRNRPAFSHPIYRSSLANNDMSIFGAKNSTFVTDDRIVWVTPRDPLYTDTVGVLANSISGKPYVVIRGLLTPCLNTRRIDEQQIVDWKVLYSQQGDVEHVLELQSGQFVATRLNNTGPEGVVLYGDGLVNVNVQGFEEGWIALILRVTHIYSASSNNEDLGQFGVCDDLEYEFRPPPNPGYYLNVTSVAKNTSTWWHKTVTPPPAATSATTGSVAATATPLVTFTFNQPSVFQNTSAIAITHIGDSCSPAKPVKFVKTMIRGKESSAMRFEMGTGFNITGLAGRLNTDTQTTFTLAMMVKFERTSCRVRILNVNPQNDNGLYICDGLQLQPEPPAGDPLAAMDWNHIVVSTSADRRTKLYVNGVLEKDWTATRVAWDGGLRIRGSSIALFNDCGKCPCTSGEDSAGWIASVSLYNSVLDSSVVKALYDAYDPGLVVDIDLTTGSLNNQLVGSALLALVDIGASCSNPNGFVSGQLPDMSKQVFRVGPGTGITIPNVSQLPGMATAEATKYTLVIKASISDTTCYHRFLTVRSATYTDLWGAYFCNELRVFPQKRDGFAGPTIAPNRFHTLAITTSYNATQSLGTTSLYVNGTLSMTWSLPAETWRKSFMLDATGAALTFFNDAGGSCVTGQNAATSGQADVARIALYNRVLTYSEIVQVTQQMQSDTQYDGSVMATPGYMKHSQFSVPTAYNIGPCRGGFFGCVAACNQLFDCVGFTMKLGVYDTTAVGIMKSVWSTQSDATQDLFRKLTIGPVLDIDATTLSLQSQLSLPRTISGIDSFGNTSLNAIRDIATLDPSCASPRGVFANVEKGAGYWNYGSDWVSLGTVSDTTSATGIWNVRCAVAALANINTEWKLRVTYGGRVDYFMGKVNSTGVRTPLCLALNSTSLHLWSASEDGDFHEALNIGLYNGGSGFFNWPPAPGSYWGSSFAVDVKWPTYVSTFPSAAYVFSRGTGLWIPNIHQLVPTNAMTSYTIVMLVKLSVADSCVRLMNVATAGTNGFMYCSHLLRIKSTIGTAATTIPVTGSHPVTDDRWQRIAISTSPSRRTTIFVNGFVDYDAIMPANNWAAALSIKDTFMSLFSSTNSPAKCGQPESAAGNLARFLLYDRPLALEEISAVFESLRVKCPGEPSECSGHGDCNYGVCQCSHEEPISEDPCTRQQRGVSAAGCNSKTACGDPLICEYCDFCPVTNLCYSGPTTRCFTHTEALVLANSVPAVTKATTTNCVNYDSTKGLTAQNYCAYRCALDKTCVGFVLKTSGGQCCMKAGYDLARQTASVGYAFYTQTCPLRVDLCAAGMSLRTGSTPRAKCEAMSRCIYSDLTGQCATQDQQVANFPAAWKGPQCSVPDCVGQPVECYGRGVCLSSATATLAAGECQCFDTADVSLARFRGTSPRYGDNQCAVRRCPGDVAISTSTWSECSGHGACDGCTGQCLCDGGYRGTSPSGWAWDCSVQQCPGDRVIQGPMDTNSSTVFSFSQYSSIDWSGESRYLVNVAGTAQDGGWTAEGVPGFTISSSNSGSFVISKNFGNTSLNNVLASSRWGTFPGDIYMTMAVNPGSHYKLQLLLYEGCCYRGFDILVNEIVIQNGVCAWERNNKAVGGAITTFEYTATTSTLAVRLRGNANAFADNNPQLQGVILREVTEQYQKSIRLVEVPGLDAKRVEVLMYKKYAGLQWGPLCNDGWGDEEASVVCRELGLGTGTAALVSGGTGPFWYRNCACTGSERDISQCCPQGVYTTCSHNAEAAVVCSAFANLTRYYESCNGHGTCTNGVCSCSANYRGPAAVTGSLNDCSVRSCPGETAVDGVITSVCNGRGTCDDIFRACTCQAGYHGGACELLDCPGAPAPFCSGHGTCNEQTGQCGCNIGWGGSACSQTVWVNLDLNNYNRDDSATNPYFSTPQLRYFAEEKVCKFKGTVVRGSGMTSMQLTGIPSSHECCNTAGWLLFISGGGGDVAAVQRLEYQTNGGSCLLWWDTARDYVSLESVTFYPTEAGRTRDFTFLDGFSAYGAPYASPHYVLTNGLCILQGLVRHDRSRSNSIIMNLPSGCVPKARLIFNQLASNSVAHVAARVDVTPLSATSARVEVVAIGGVDNWAPNLDWVSLAGIVFPTVTATSTLSMQSPVGNYGYEYLAPSYYLTPNLCVLNGLSTRNGYAGSTYVYMPSMCQPATNRIFYLNQHQSQVRLDLKQNQLYLSPNAVPVQSWIPYDGIVVTRS
eukprot:c13059_g1_i1.p1 GENE.c13059_g1_i1~~c13059_g1_i1.p1  ORF type:complete len:2319 (+),score=542.84 c13059_g1_i1:37-6993(+)